MGSECLVAVFATMKEPDFLGKFASKTTHEILKVAFVERVVGGDVVSLSELLGCAFGSVAIGKSNEAISMKIEVHTCFVGDSHSPHANPIKTAAETLTASNFQGCRGFREDQSTAYWVLVALEGRVTRHVIDECRRVADGCGCSWDGCQSSWRSFCEIAFARVFYGASGAS